MDQVTNQRGESIESQEGHPNLRKGSLEKFDTPEKRQEFYQAYCDHISKGFSDDSFSFEGSGIKVFKNYREKYKSEFPSDMIEDAQARRLLFWENIGLHGTIGAPIKVNGKEYSRFNAQSWQFNMQNRFKWKSREDVTTDDDKLPSTPLIMIDTHPAQEESK